MKTKDNDTKDKKRRHVDSLKGFCAAFLSVTMVVTSTTSVQLLQRKIPDFELNTIRSVIALLLYSMVLILRRENILIPRSEIFATFCISFLYFVNSIGFYIAVTFVPVSSAEAIRITSGILSGLVLFAFLCEETITMAGLLCATCCITGVVLTTQPPFLFSKLLHKQDTWEIDVNNTTVIQTNNMGTTFYWKYCWLYFASNMWIGSFNHFINCNEEAISWAKQIQSILLDIFP